MDSLQDLFGLKGKTALVTGASSGLGVEFARALASAGADVAILARRSEKLEGVAREIETLGVRCLPVTADVTDPEALEKALEETVKSLGGLDILVNNAGIADFGKAEKLSREKWDEVLAVNLTAPFQLAQKAARIMIRQGRGGRIINISSVAGEVANPIFPTVAYSASKAALTNMTRQLAVEWAGHSITVNAIAPGWFPSEMTVDPSIGEIKPENRERIEAQTPLGRLGRPGELMGAVIYLASPAASYVTGAILPVDGGWLAW